MKGSRYALSVLHLVLGLRALRASPLADLMLYSPPTVSCEYSLCLAFSSSCLWSEFPLGPDIARRRLALPRLLAGPLGFVQAGLGDCYNKDSAGVVIRLSAVLRFEALWKLFSVESISACFLTWFFP